MMKASELRTKTEKELLTELNTLKKSQFNQRFKRAAAESVNPADVRKARKNIARINTVLNELRIKGGK